MPSHSPETGQNPPHLETETSWGTEGGREGGTCALSHYTGTVHLHVLYIMQTITITHNYGSFIFILRELPRKSH